MKFLLSILLIALLSLGAELYLPFWSVALAAFTVSALIPQKPLFSFLCGFTALFLLWAGLAWYLDEGNNHILSVRVSALFKLPSPVLLVIVTGFIGGILGGMASLSASFLRKR